MVDGFFTWPRFYKDMVNQFPAGSVFVEIGLYKGASMIYLINQIWLSDKDIKVIGVDHFIGQSEGLLKKFKENTFHIKDWFGLMVMTSKEASTLIDRVDMVFIDAAHDYESVKEDIELWLPKTKGVIAGHDYFGGYPGVVRAVDEAFGDKVIRDYEDENVWMVKIN